MAIQVINYDECLCIEYAKGHNLPVPRYPFPQRLAWKLLLGLVKSSVNGTQKEGE